MVKRKTLPELDVRRGVEGDAEALNELADALEAEGFTGPNSIKALKGGQKWIHGFVKDDRVHNKEHPRKWIFFAFDGDRLVGNVNGFEWDSPLAKKEEIEELKAIYHLPDKMVGHVGIHVHPDYREKGVGEALMQRAIQEAKELSVEILTINTWVKSMPTIRLAEKMGFKEHMRLKKGYEVGYGRVLKEPMVFMTMDIQ